MSDLKPNGATFDAILSDYEQKDTFTIDLISGVIECRVPKGVSGIDAMTKAFSEYRESAKACQQLPWWEGGEPGDDDLWCAFVLKYYVVSPVLSDKQAWTLVWQAGGLVRYIRERFDTESRTMRGAAIHKLIELQKKTAQTSESSSSEPAPNTTEDTQASAQTE
jgi:hypothetical protein